MAKSPLPTAGDSAEKAYAAAAETNSKDKRQPKAAPARNKAAVVPPVKAKPPVAKAPTAEDVPALPSFKDKAAKSAPAEAVAAEPLVPTPVVPPEVAVAAAPVVAAAALIEPAPVSKSDTTPADSEVSQLKEEIMNAETTDFTAARDALGGLKNAFSDAKAKAKAAFDKSTSSLGEATDFAKGNVEAVVESGKIYAAGLQEIGSSYVAESKAALEALTADVKELTAQKTPVDFFKLHTELAKKNVESAVAFGTKTSEAWLKLASDAFAPLSTRVNLAVDKIKAAA